jgi:hypothetical protein
VVTDEPEPDFEDVPAVALNNTGIDTADCMRAARVAPEAVAAAPIRALDGPRLAVSQESRTRNNSV